MADSNAESSRQKKLLREQTQLKFMKSKINRMIKTGCKINSIDSMHIFTAVYKISKEKQGAETLHKYYQEFLKDYLSSKALPHLKGKRGEILLKELVEQWDNYTTFQEKLSELFDKLPKNWSIIPPLKKTSHSIFNKVVYSEIKVQVSQALESEINLEGNNTKEIDEAVMKKVEEIHEKINRVI